MTIQVYQHQPCPDCGVEVGAQHGEDCDVARCLATGEQRLMHEMLGARHDCGNAVWTGEWPGVAECREFGWYTVFEPGSGFRPVPPGAPGAGEDLNRLAVDAVWDPVAQRWQQRETVGDQS